MEDPDQIDILVPEMDPEIARASADAAEVGASIMTAATNFGDALTFLNGQDCANMSSAQKYAFFAYSTRSRVDRGYCAISPVTGV